MDAIRLQTTERMPRRGAERERSPLWREALGAFLRRERLEQRRILSDVAGAADVSTQYLSEIERGRKEPSSEILAAVADALGLTLLDIAAGVAGELARDEVAAAPRPLVLLDLTARGGHWPAHHETSAPVAGSIHDVALVA
ncbi:Helix-turn-helix domain-containing protein [Agromyces sp. CF514]|uniref:helix-turn-helix domain-containing protein n=1 Tax=Agromyces sp. CF514 TaxID=1881031 RepID=UPI0008E3CB63|nr:helix-turn-helix transcriptional regulator [Agromyces sp. CF514]SFR83273.1 Helix-turn-helix domain-containing protein [Agromyces sp. CF514]